MGPSGSGKTTLLNLLGGLDTPSEGSITVGGDRIDRLAGGRLSAWRARHIGFVFQLYNLLPVLTAAAERRAAAAADQAVEGRPPASACRWRCRWSASPTAMNHYPRQLSGGQEQRVGIARAIVTDPTLLLCDEPTGDLDRKSGDEILDLLQTLNREHGKTIVMVTHDPHAAARARRALCTSRRGAGGGGGRHEVLPARLAQPDAAQGPHDVHAAVDRSSPSCSSAS